MEDKEESSFEQEAIKDNPAQTIAPPQITLQQEPIPNPNIENENKN